MNSLKFEMYAKNSSGIQELYLNMDGDEPFFTLVGDYRGNDIQIDFDVTSKVNLLKMKQMIEIALAT